MHCVLAVKPGLWLCTWTAWAAHRPDLLTGGAVDERRSVRKVGPQACRAMLPSGTKTGAISISAALQHAGPSASDQAATGRCLQHSSNHGHALAAAAWARLLQIRLHLDPEGLWPGLMSAQTASVMLSLKAGCSAHHVAASGG